MKKSTEKLLKTTLVIVALIAILSGGDASSEDTDKDYKTVLAYSRNFEFDTMLETESLKRGLFPFCVGLNFFSESGLDPMAHVDLEGTKYKSYFGPISSNTIGGGLFGLMKRFCKAPVWPGSFESYMNSGAIEQMKAYFRLLDSQPKKLAFIAAERDPKKQFGLIRLCNFAPAKLTASDDTDVYIDDPRNPHDAYSANAHLDLGKFGNKDGKISVGELKHKWDADYEKAAASYEKFGSKKVKTKSGF